uniref:C2H2-type domain-containing protein n=1 Tax=Stomoxys calcitrans TaxID=35570 RepID=A0A1I8PYB2_STOCA
MLQPTSLRCRLCIKICTDNQHHRLYDEAGHTNETYELMSRYFTTAMLNMAWDKQFSHICELCWHHLKEFHEFQQLVIEAQATLGSDLGSSTKKQAAEFEAIESINIHDSDPSDMEFQEIPIAKLKSSLDIEKPRTATEGIKMAVILEDNNSSKLLMATPSKDVIDSEAGILKEFSEMSSMPFKTEELLMDPLDNSPPSQAFVKQEPMEEVSQHIPDSLKSQNFCDPDNDSCSRFSNNEYDFSQSPLLEELSQQDMAEDQPSAEKQCRKVKTVQESDCLISKWKPYLECVVCEQKLFSFTLLLQHFQQEHPSAECHIFCCQKKLRHRLEIEKHVEYHQAPKRLRCDICFLAFTRFYAVSFHKEQMHAAKSALQSFECSLCNASFPDNESLQRHIQQNCLYGDEGNLELSETEAQRQKHRHKKEDKIPRTVEEFDSLIAKWKPLLSCVVCQQQVDSFSKLLQHFRELHPSEDCHILCCQHKLRHRYEIEKHIDYHHTPPKLRCDDCCRSFKRVYSRSMHMQQHHSEQGKSYDCKRCSARFKTASYLRRHFQKGSCQNAPAKDMRTHPFACKQCDRSYMSLNSLKRHCAIIHTDNASILHRCTVCDKAFRYNSYIRKHMWKQHGVKWSSEYSTLSEIASEMAEVKPRRGEQQEEMEEEEGEEEENEDEGNTMISLVVKSETSWDLEQNEEAQEFKEKEKKKKQKEKENKEEERKKEHEEKKDKNDENKEEKKQQHSSLNESQKEFLTSDEDELPLADSKSKLSLSKLKNFQLNTRQDFDRLIALWRPNLPCVICDQNLQTFSLLQEHFSQSHPLEKCHIRCCELELYFRYEIEQHIRYHCTDEKHRCNICYQVFQVDVGVKEHMIKVHGAKANRKKKFIERNFRCELCQRSFRNRKALGQHNYLQHPKPGQQSLNCEICDKPFKGLTGLREHMSMHKGETKHGCPCCSKVFTYRADVYRHMKRHHPQEWEQTRKEKRKRKFENEHIRYGCRFCAKEFCSQEILLRHLKEDHAKEEAEGLDDNGEQEFQQSLTFKEDLNLMPTEEFQPSPNYCQSTVENFRMFSSNQYLIAEENGQEICFKIEEVPEDGEHQQEDFEGDSLSFAHEKNPQTSAQDQATQHARLEFEEIVQQESPWGFNIKKEIPENSQQQYQDYEVNSPSFSRETQQQTFLQDQSTEDSKCESFCRTKIQKTLSQQEFDHLVSEWRPKLECELCHISCSHYTQLLEHFTQQHDPEECFITCCNRKLQGPQSIQPHILYHKALPHTRCDLCCKTFKTNLIARDHRNRVHGKKIISHKSRIHGPPTIDRRKKSQKQKPKFSEEQVEVAKISEACSRKGNRSNSKSSLKGEALNSSSPDTTAESLETFEEKKTKSKEEFFDDNVSLLSEVEESITKISVCHEENFRESHRNISLTSSKVEAMNISSLRETLEIGKGENKSNVVGKEEILDDERAIPKITVSDKGTSRKRIRNTSQASSKEEPMNISSIEESLETFKDKRRTYRAHCSQETLDDESASKLPKVNEDMLKISASDIGCSRKSNRNISQTPYKGESLNILSLDVTPKSLEVFKEEKKKKSKTYCKEETLEDQTVNSRVTKTFKTHDKEEYNHGELQTMDEMIDNSISKTSKQNETISVADRSLEPLNTIIQFKHNTEMKQQIENKEKSFVKLKGIPKARLRTNVSSPSTSHNKQDKSGTIG